MPKHVSLAIRHLSGSAQLMGLLNGFGYSTSHSYVLKHDIALCMQEILLSANVLPSSLQKGQFTTFVWDNNDFGEQTLSGKGSTHNTNSIAIQHGKLAVASPEAASSVAVTAPIMKKPKQHALPAPGKDIDPLVTSGECHQKVLHPT